tara:strand:- start:92 stop:343 length:252 start_codon:yes stop_codon:yes gene_type:complete
MEANTEEILSGCYVSSDGSLYLGRCLPNFKDPVGERVNILRNQGYKFKLKEDTIFGEQLYFCDQLNLSYKTDYYGDSSLNYSG